MLSEDCLSSDKGYGDGRGISEEMRWKLESLLDCLSELREAEAFLAAIESAGEILTNQLQQQLVAASAAMRSSGGGSGGSVGGGGEGTLNAPSEAEEPADAAAAMIAGAITSIGSAEYGEEEGLSDRAGATTAAGISTAAQQNRWSAAEEAEEAEAKAQAEAMELVRDHLRRRLTPVDGDALLALGLSDLAHAVASDPADQRDLEALSVQAAQVRGRRRFSIPPPPWLFLFLRPITATFVCQPAPAAASGGVFSRSKHPVDALLRLVPSQHDAATPKHHRCASSCPHAGGAHQILRASGSGVLQANARLVLAALEPAEGGGLK